VHIVHQTLKSSVMLRHIACQAVPEEFLGCSTLNMDAAHFSKTLV